MIIPIKHFYMIRHGETEANAAKIMAGSTDSPLTENGRMQAYNTHKILENLEIKPELIVHSHLSRARDTATIINKVLNVPMIEDPGFAEMHSGDWEGAPYEQCSQLFTDWVDAPNGESAKEFFSRVRDAKRRILEQYDIPVLVVCHGGVMRAVGEIQNISVPGRFKNAHLHEFTPLKAENNFPWQVWEYDLCPKNTLIRQRSVLYHADLARAV